MGWDGLSRPIGAAKAAAVPYAEFGDPQSLNLYSYVRNVPTTRYDADGHCQQDGSCLAQQEVNKFSLEPKSFVETAKGFFKEIVNAVLTPLNNTVGHTQGDAMPLTNQDQQIGARISAGAVAAIPAAQETAGASLGVGAVDGAASGTSASLLRNGAAFPEGTQAGQILENIDASTLQAGRTSLDAGRLATQQDLISSGTPRTTPIQATQEGVIWDGNHGARAAADANVPVNVQVIKPPISPTPKGPVQDLPVRQ